MTQFLFVNFGQTLLTEAILADDTILEVDPLQAEKLPQPGVGQAFALILWDGVEPQEIVYCTSNPFNGFLTVSRGEEGTTPRAWLAGTQVRNFLTSGTISEIIQTGFIEGNRASEAQARAGTSNLVLMTPLSTSYFFDERSTEASREFLLQTSVEALRSYLGWQTATFSGTGLETNFTLPDASWDTPFTRVYVDQEYQTGGYTIDGADLAFDVPPSAGTDNIVVVFGQNFAFSVSFPGNNTVSEDALIDGAVTTDKIADSAVTTIKINAKAVTLAKMQDVTGPILLGRTSGTGSPQEIIPTPDDLGFGPRVFNTGDLKSSMRTSVPTGWIRMNGGTIGNAASGATTRANADTEALFTLWWNDFNNTILPIFDSAGVATTRGASAAADFAANKRLRVFDPRGKFLRIWDDGRGIDTGRVIGDEQAEQIGPHTHTATFTGTPLGTHSHSTSLTSFFGANTNSNRGFSSGDSTNGSLTAGTSSVSAGTPAGTVDVATNSGLENRPANMSVPLFVKL